MGGYILAGKNTRNNIIKMKKRQKPMDWNYAYFVFGIYHSIVCAIAKSG